MRSGRRPAGRLSPVRLERDAQVELPALVGLQQFEELIPGDEATIDNDALGVDAAADALERHLDRRAVLDQEALRESLPDLSAQPGQCLVPLASAKALKT